METPATPACRRARGFSMGELLIAVALLGLVIVTVIGLFVTLMNGSTKGLDQTVALDIAQNELDFCAGSAPAKWLALNNGTLGLSETHTVTDPRSPIPFYWVLTPTELSEPSGVTGAAAYDFAAHPKTNAMGDMYRLDMDVYWWPDAAKTSVINVTSIASRGGMGRLSVHLSRIVYIENMKQ
jgi:type II secretory pathway pseudopilin PulG